MGTRRKIDSFADWDSENEILSVLGPTASGKTNLLLAFLERRSWKIRPLLISLDSVAVYRYLDIGSAKPLGRDRENWEWAGIDLSLIHI